MQESLIKRELFVFCYTALICITFCTQVPSDFILQGKASTKTSQTSLKNGIEAKLSNPLPLEPQLFTHFFQKLLTRTQNWKDNVKKVADSFVSNYFNKGNESLPAINYKSGKDVVSYLSHTGLPSTKAIKENHKRSVNKPIEKEQETKKPFNFAPIVQFIPANLDFSNKILLYQPQVIINGSVFVKQVKEPDQSYVMKPKQGVLSWNEYQ